MAPLSRIVCCIKLVKSKLYFKRCQIQAKHSWPHVHTPIASEGEGSLPPHNSKQLSHTVPSLPYDLHLFPGVVHQGFPGSVMSLAYAFDILPVGTQKAASETSLQSVAHSLYSQSMRTEAYALPLILVTVTHCECKTEVNHLTTDRPRQGPCSVATIPRA